MLFRFLKAQPLPSVSVTVDGKSEGIIAKGSTVELEVNAVNFEGDIVLSASTANNDAKNVEEFMALGGLNTDGTNNEIGAVTEGHYILVNDIVLDNYYPFSANFSSLDGNGHYITIKGFNTDKYKAGNVTNIGLFETVPSNITPVLITPTPKA